MKLILTNSFIKSSSVPNDINRQPTSFPEDGPGQDALLSRENNDKESIIDRWKKNRKVPTNKIYQFGLDVPAVEKK